MLRWTLKSLVLEPLGFLVSVAALASAFLLVMFFEGVYVGISEQIVAYVRNVDADVWVMQRGVSNMHMATSYLSDWKVREVEEVPGVAQVDPILYLNSVVEGGGERWFAYVVGLDVPSALAGPWSMVGGRAQPSAGEAVVPAAFAEMTDLGLGDAVRVAGKDFTVVGLSEGTFSMANSVVFVTKSDLEDIMSSLDIFSFLLVKATPGMDPSVLAAEIERQVEKVSALPSEQFVANDYRMAMQMGVETVALMTIIGAALAVLLVVFTVYSQITRQRQELAVAKAVGTTNGALYGSVMLQAGILTLLGVSLAALLAALTMPIVTTLVPAAAVKLTFASVVRSAVVGLGVALCASVVPARQVARVDPMSAFHV